MAYVHVGTNNAGPSNLQTQSLNARSTLLESGVHVPRAMHGRKMLLANGLVSAGNAYSLSEQVRALPERASELCLFGFAVEALARFAP